MQFFDIILPSMLLSVALANDVKFYTARSCSVSAYSGCYGIAHNVCCVSRSGSIQATSVSKGPTDFAQMWSNGGCTTQQCVSAEQEIHQTKLTCRDTKSAGGSGTYCCLSSGNVRFTGGSYYTLSKRSEEDQTKCTSTMEANFFGYASGNTSWEIRAEQAKDKFSKLQEEFHDVPDAKKVSWLKANGAVQVTTPVSEIKTANAADA